MINIDLIKNAIVFFRNMANGPNVLFAVENMAEWDVTDLLDGAGIPHWGMFRMTDGRLVFRVSPGRGRQTMALLRKNYIEPQVDWSHAKQNKKESALSKIIKVIW